MKPTQCDPSSYKELMKGVSTLENVIMCSSNECQTMLPFKKGYILFYDGEEGRNAAVFCSWECYLKCIATDPTPH